MVDWKCFCSMIRIARRGRWRRSDGIVGQIDAPKTQAALPRGRRDAEESVRPIWVVNDLSKRIRDGLAERCVGRLAHDADEYVA